MHALIVGANGAGKSTLIRSVLKELDRPVFGFETRKEDALADTVNGSPIYIYEAGKEKLPAQENLVGYCRDRRAVSILSGFDRFASRLTQPIPESCLVEMDEIGFLESKSEPFCKAVLSLLDGEVPVIAAVRDKNIPFLNAVRSHPNVRCFPITPENRDRLFDEVLAFMKAQLGE